MKLHSLMLTCRASFAALLLSVLFYGCRKLDIKTQPDPQKYEHLKQLFFNTDNTNDIEIKNLAANIEKQDSIFKFLPGFAEKNGIPRWDKVIYSTRKKSNLSKKRTPTPATKQSTLEEKENPGIFLIPLQSQNSDEIKAYITAYKHTDSLYSYRLYNKDSMNAIKTESSKSKNNLLTAMAVFGFFEKAINDVDSVVIKAPFNGAIKGVNIELVDETLQKQKLKRNPTPLSQPYIGPDGCIAIVNIQINITSVIIYDPPYTFTTIDWYTIQLYIGIYCNTSTTGDPNVGGSSGSSNWWNYGSGWPIYSASYDPNWYGWWNTGLGSGGGGGSVFSSTVESLQNQLGLTFEQSLWLESQPKRALEIYSFTYATYYSDVSPTDKYVLAVAHLNKMMVDPDYYEMVEAYSVAMAFAHPWMIELFKEMAIEIGIKVIQKYLPGYGDWQSIKDAIENAGHGNWLGVLGEVLNIVKKKVPAVAVFDAIFDVFDFGTLANKAWKAFDKLKDLPSPAFNGLLKTIKDKCGGILDKIEHDNNIQGKIKYDPSDAFNFFKDLANDLGINYTPFNTPNGPGGTFDLPGGFTIKYYPVSSTINPATGMGYPTIEILKNNVTIYKFRFEL